MTDLLTPSFFICPFSHSPSSTQSAHIHMITSIPRRHLHTVPRDGT